MVIFQKSQSVNIMTPIDTSDLILINNLSSRQYTDNKLLSNATENERNQLDSIVNKLRTLSEYFSRKYTASYGPFDTSVTTGNPIAIGGKSFKRVWAGIFKGAPNKQYAAQISFVMNPEEARLDVGFYFGRASGHSLTREQRIALESQLTNLGLTLSNNINNNPNVRSRYSELFDFGFIAYNTANILTEDEWLNTIRTKTKNSQIVAKIYPNNFGIIENSTIDSFVSQIIFLMGSIPNPGDPAVPVVIRPLTPEQRVKQAERLAEIGQKGELHIMEVEKQKLRNIGIDLPNYPKHVALESTHFGYDVLSLDEQGHELFIEVKTTTRPKEDRFARSFYITTNELNVYFENKRNYRLYRVYNIEGEPSLDVLDLEDLVKQPNGYIVTY
jgi:hypothetical protein